jgi:cysteine-rich repeat protein
MRTAIAITTLALLAACADEGGETQASASSTSTSAGGTTSGGGGASCGNGVVEGDEICDDGNGSGDDDCLPTCTTSVPFATGTFTPSDEDLLNPERGFYHDVDLAGGGDASHVRAEGLTLAYAGVILDAYRDQPLDDGFLEAIDAGLGAVRDARVKVVLRFAYNDDGGDDAPKARILEHLGQLQPILEKNADVIAVVQAGLIGAWGEWHSSSNGLDNPADRAEILHALLDVTPPSRMVQIRTPMFKDEAFPGGPLTEAQAWTGSDQARVGHHNDCFLASDSDLGTYEDPIDDWKAYVASDGRFTPVGGETCGIDMPRSDCAAATAEMAAHHWSFLNILYHLGVIGEWQSPSNGGAPCYDDIRRRLGYRVEITAASWSESVAPGGALGVTVTVVNRGYAALYNERPLYVVVGSGADRRAAKLDAVDARSWAPGEEITINAWLRVPADIAEGQHRLALWLPDDAESIRDLPEYAVALANQSMFDPGTGDNVLTEELAVDASAPGAVDPAATELAEIP